MATLVAFDIEATDLAASWGRVLCCSFCVWPSMETHTIRMDDYRLVGKDMVDDSRLVAAIRDEIEAADILLGWNSILYDIPMLNARLQFARERPIELKMWPKGNHLDLMYYATGQALRIGGKRLDTVAKFFGLDVQKTPLDGVTWQRAAVGDIGALDMVVEHCEHDVQITAKLFPILAPHIKKLQLPISKWWKFAHQIEL